MLNTRDRQNYVERVAYALFCKAISEGKVTSLNDQEVMEECKTKASEMYEELRRANANI